MVDERIKKLASILVNYSIRVEKKKIIQVNFDIEAKDLALEVYKEILKKGAFAKFNVNLPEFEPTFYEFALDDQLKHLPKVYIQEAKLVDGMIAITARNYKELSTISSEKLGKWQKTSRLLSDLRLKKGNWVLCGFPSESLAKDAGMPLKDFEDFVFSSTNIDWEEMSNRQDLLKKVLDKGKKVRIIGEGTDLTFSIKGNKGIKCDGKYNMPDGEVFTAPKKDSVNGTICFTFPTVYHGREVKDVVLEFKKGKVINLSASKNVEFLKNMLEIDDGAKYIGEFGVGMNYSIKKFIKNTLFDEKIGGTIHLALGNAYRESGGKNQSAIHWDMVTKPDKVFIDDKIILKDGEFMF